jgi:hypothetical protein
LHNSCKSLKICLSGPNVTSQKRLSNNVYNVGQGQRILKQQSRIPPNKIHHAMMIATTKQEERTARHYDEYSLGLQ